MDKKTTAPQKQLRVIGLTIIFALMSLAMITDDTSTRNPQPNILIFLADDLGWGDLGCYGHPFMMTPNLDRLAEQGMRFTDCHSGGPICSPSRAALLTGRAPYRLGIWGLTGGTIHMREQEITIPEILKNAGYQTFFAGKWHMGNFFNQDGTIPTPGDHGFDLWMARSQQIFTDSGVVRAKDEFLTNDGPVPYKNGGSCDEVVAESIRMLKKRDPGKPFFIEICSREPHTPLTPPENFQEMYDTERVRRLEQYIRYGRVPRPSHVDNQPELHRYYYGTVTQLDAAFGKLMKALEEMGVSNNTLVFFTSDNGPEFPQTGWPECYRSWGTPGEFRGMKRHLYEGGTRVPGIIRWTGQIKPGSVSEELISATDLLPTICDLLGLPVPGDRKIDGTSIAPVLHAEPFERTQPLFWNICYTHAPQMAMRLGDYALLGYFDPIGQEEPMQTWIKEARLEGFEMYNLKRDPRQEVDLKYKEPELFNLFSEKMKRVLTEIQDDSPTWPNQTGGTLPINVSFQIGIPGSDIK